MPHMFTNRPKNFDLTDLDAGPEASFRWETLNAVIYKLGGAVFMAGSVMFFPALDRWSNLGAWLFVAGSAVFGAADPAAAYTEIAAAAGAA